MTGPYDPSDVDLLTFAIFEGAFVCMCTAHLFGGLAKDRISARYRRASLTDPLTDVANRRGFFEAGKRLLKRARFARQPTALIMFDLDRFKSINDRYGHHTGDEVLTAFCRLASSQLRPNDLFGRIGGEEFASLLPDTGHHDAVWLAAPERPAGEKGKPAGSGKVGAHRDDAVRPSGTDRVSGAYDARALPGLASRVAHDRVDWGQRGAVFAQRWSLA